MSFGEILSQLLIGPLKILFEFIYQIAEDYVENPGLAIIFLSLIMNILVLPLYKRADAMQEEARDIDAKLHKGVSHIKKVFSGDEKMMILQTYYRQNNYKPTDALKGSVSLLLEIPFFMAAYQFLSHLDNLNGASLGPISDLGKPDGLIIIGGLTVNLLPILMTLINVISSAIYLKGFPMKTKVQLYGMALFFLVFLYQSPSGLVFYWTLNNLFSLVKTIFYKIKNPKKVLRIVLSVAGVGIIMGGACMYIFKEAAKKGITLAFLGILLQFPLILSLFKFNFNISDKLTGKAEPNKKMFVLGSIFLTLLIGVLIPSAVISSSPQEFVDIYHFHHPLWYILSCACLSAGTFLIWMRVFYWLAKPKGKVIFDRFIWILCGIALVNYMFFGTNLGILTFTLQYESDMTFTLLEQALNLVILLAVAIILYFCAVKWKKAVISVLLVASIAMGTMSVINIATIKTSIDDISSTKADNQPEFTLSKTGKNVVVLMMDRAMNNYLPYLFNEKPELKKQFDGFTYYSNTLSFGGHTNLGAPALMGGYEYTPVEMNKRSSEALVSKHNEALKVMPLLFAENGYDVTVCDPPYANYNWIPDLSVYDDYPEITSYITKGKFGDETQRKQAIDYNHRNFFCFSLMKTTPLPFQPMIYGNGTYSRALVTGDINYTTQTIEGTSKASGYFKNFMDSYDVLTNLTNITKITDDKTNTFMFMANDATHEVALLQEPQYEPAYEIDNTEFDKDNSHRFTLNGKTLTMETGEQYAHYQCNMSSMSQIGNWLDYLRENDVYNNTKIIIVADHGYNLYHDENLILGNITEQNEDINQYCPLLMVKDFNSKGFTTSDEFMTNADVPTLATNNLIENPKNPFTGKAINSNEKTAHKQMVTLSHEWQVEDNDGNTYVPSKWASVDKNVWDKNNWTFSDKEMVLNNYNIK